MEIVARGIAIRSEPGTGRQSCAFPGIAVLPSGRWLCTCRAAPTKGATAGQQVLVTWSDDLGRTWSPPVSPFTPPQRDGKPGLFRAAHATALGGATVVAVLYWVDASDPARPFFNEQTEGLLDSFVYLARSSDGGQTWSAPAPVDTTPFTMPVPITGPILLLRSGEWVLQFETNKSYDDTAPWRHASVLMFSPDSGRTWPRHVRVAFDPEGRRFWWDQRPGVLADGRILDTFWTFDRTTATYQNIHARESCDHGHAWSELWDTGVPGQPAPPVSLADGRIALVYVDRTGPPVIRLRVSSDDGRTWPASTQFDLYDSALGRQETRKTGMQDAWSEMAKFSVGLPATARLANGDLLVVYYAGSHTDVTGIEWVRVGA